MPSPLPKFDEPPVVETLMGVQFDQLPNYTSAHAGWYWKAKLDEHWTKTVETTRIDDQFELFGDDKKWAMKAFRVRAGTQPERIQIIRDDDERMIQVQGTRFIYNWRKRESRYPTYDRLRPEFDERFRGFSEFVAESGLGTIVLNQWEMTYVNHIPKGTVWETPDDWAKLFPGFYAPRSDTPRHRLEGFGGEWHMVIGDNIGRLHVSIEHGRIGSAQGPEALIVNLTARGPITGSETADGDMIGARFDLGRESIVRTFAAITSEAAHRYWKRRV